jgi:uncharacterized membrane protein YjgN (DUF898 family)
VIYAVFFGLLMTQELAAMSSATSFSSAAFIGLIPLIIHGTYRYRMSRSSWRGIHFGYRGELKELYAICIRDGLLTLVTFGIYGSWFQMNLRNYVIGHVRFGSSQFAYKGDGLDFFLMNLKGYFLTLFTLGIYGFWWQKDIFNYYVNNLSWSFSRWQAPAVQEHGHGRWLLRPHRCEPPVGDLHLRHRLCLGTGAYDAFVLATSPWWVMRT